ncbi:MAG TPA: MOSC N-terminal beta barrel domain-containing protein [Gaiellaceae bacterium]|nr:MOSC N-terminal beta barrel domain-containing protein [Gaiellaceae bacterium]
MATVAQINITPVKGLGLLHPDEVELTAVGVAENRRFYLVTADRGLLFNGKDYGPLVRVSPELSGDRLELHFPDGTVVGGEIELGHDVTTNFWGRPVNGRVVQGPWSTALSEFTGDAVLLVRTEESGDGSDVCVGTLIARASCERLAQELGAPVDPRRFRMLLELDGLDAHEEDTWDGRVVRAGDAVLIARGPVPRCAVTTQDPDSGEVNLDTVRAIKDYRGLRNRKAIDFGIYFDVEQPGRVRVGDAVELV